MPAKSPAQYRLMQAAAHNPEVAKRTGIPQGVAEEFVHKTPAAKRKRFAKKGWGRKGHQ
jgi:hypothetical protein